MFADTAEDYDRCGNCVYKRDSSLLFGGYHAIILHSLVKRDNRYFAYLFKTSWRTIKYDKTINFLIGENNIGKTNILELLNIFLCVGKFAESDFKCVLQSIQIKIKIEYDKGKQIIHIVSV